MQLRVASFNVRNGRAFDGWSSWPFRRGITAEAVAALDAPLVALQEAYRCQLRSLLRALPRYDAVGEGRAGGRRGEHCPLLWDPSALELVEHRTRWYGDAPDLAGTQLPGARFPRVATVARFRLGPGHGALQVVGTHLDAEHRHLRRRAVEQLVTWLDPGVPRIVLGDLNARPGAPELEPLTAAGLRDALEGVEGGTEHRFTGRTDGKRIDHVFVSPEVEVRSAEVLHLRPRGRLPSDHWPVAATLQVPTSSGPRRPPPGVVPPGQSSSDDAEWGVGGGPG